MATEVEPALPYLGLYGSLDQLLVGALPDLDPWLLIDLPLEFLDKYVPPPVDLEPDTSLGTFLPNMLLGCRLTLFGRGNRDPDNGLRSFLL